MKQRLLSICMALALALCLTLLPTAAWAAEGGGRDCPNNRSPKR